MYRCISLWGKNLHNTMVLFYITPHLICNKYPQDFMWEHYLLSIPDV